MELSPFGDAMLKQNSEHPMSLFTNPRKVDDELTCFLRKHDLVSQGICLSQSVDEPTGMQILSGLGTVVC